MQPFRAHIHRQGSRWVWEIRQGRGGASTCRSGTVSTRAAAIRAALNPNRPQLPAPPPYPAALAA